MTKSVFNVSETGFDTTFCLSIVICHWRRQITASMALCEPQTLDSIEQRTRMSRRPYRVWLTLVALTVGIGGLSDCAHADDPLDDLRQRIEQLEQDNRDLRASLLAKTSAEELPDPLIPPDPDQAITAGEEEQRIGALVEKYLQQRPAAPGPVDLSQDQNIHSLQGSVADILKRLNSKTLPFIQVLSVIQSDAGWISQDHDSLLSYGRIQNGVDFRRARLGAKATVTDSTNGFFQMDFAFFGRPTFADVWVEQTQIPGIGTVRIGQWKQPFSLEVVSSFRYTTFVERSVLFQSFSAFRHLGVGFYNNAEDLSMTWAASVFGAGNDQFGDSLSTAGGWGTAERVTYCPWYNEQSKGREYLHLGLAHYFSAPPNKSTIFRTIPELYIGAVGNGLVGTSGQAVSGPANGIPFFVNTGQLGVNNFNVLGTEVLFVNGPLSFQSEAMVTMVNQASNVFGTVNTAGGSMATLEGMYAQVGYFLTGEHRPYDRKSATIERVVPFQNFAPWKGDGCGWGAWEVAGRWSYINLNDQNIRGGQMNDYTAGLNWFLTPYWKIQFNYIFSNSQYSYAPSLIGGGASNTPAGKFLGNHTSLFDLRCQLDF